MYFHKSNYIDLGIIKPTEKFSAILAKLTEWTYDLTTTTFSLASYLCDMLTKHKKTFGNKELFVSYSLIASRKHLTYTDTKEKKKNAKIKGIIDDYLTADSYGGVTENSFKALSLGLKYKALKEGELKDLAKLLDIDKEELKLLQTIVDEHTKFVTLPESVVDKTKSAE